MTHIQQMASAFQDELTKIAEAKLAAGGKIPKAVPLMAAGAVGWEAVRRANQDRKIGRQVRLQQGSGGF